MKLQVLQEDLSKALNIAIHFVNTRQSLPVLSNFLLIAEKTTLKVQATNLEISINLKLGAKIETEGRVTVPAKAFLEIISNLNLGPLNLTLVKEQLKIDSEGFKGSIPTTPANDFPKVPEKIIESNSFTIPSKDLLSALTKVLPASSSDETRPVLNGVLFVFDGKLLSLVSSDGFRLSQKSIALSKKVSSNKFQIIIPRFTLSELVKIAKGAGDVIFENHQEDNQLLMKIGDIVLSTRLIDGNFPDFEKIIPKSTGTKVSLDKNDLKRGVKLSAVFARDSANVILLSVKSSLLRIRSESGKSGKEDYEIEVKVEGTASDENPLNISFNYKFIEDFLNGVEGDSVEIKLIDSASPAIFVDPSDPSFLHLIMPVKVQS